MTLMIEGIIFLQKVCVEKTGNINYRRNNYTGVEIKQKPQSGRKKYIRQIHAGGGPNEDYSQYRRRHKAALF